MKHDKQSLLGEYYLQLKNELLDDIRPIYKPEHSRFIEMIDPKAIVIEDLTVPGLSLLFNFIKSNVTMETAETVLHSRLVLKNEKTSLFKE